MVDLEKITSPIHAVLAPLGFRRDGKRVWYFSSEEVNLCVHLDKSSYGPQNRVIVWGVFRALRDERASSQVCSFYFDCDQSMGRPNSLRRAFDQEDESLDEDTRRAMVTQMMVNYCVPTLQEIHTEIGVLSTYRKIGKKSVFALLLQALNYLETKQHSRS